ncbi:MAG: hypothetical protein JJ992_25895, partial [Planctomycetes bacterium]|nr:hypothetical protein [Planctomycetota bacterium]
MLVRVPDQYFAIPGLPETGMEIRNEQPDGTATDDQRPFGRGTVCPQQASQCRRGRVQQNRVCVANAFRKSPELGDVCQASRGPAAS